MKNKILLYSLFASLFLIGCKKDDGPIAKGDGVTIDVVPSMAITKVAGFTGDIIPSTIASYVGKIKIDFLYSYLGIPLTPPEKVDLVIIKNGNKADVKVLKAGVTGPFPIEVSFTGPELLTLFGSVVTCDGFQVGFNVYANGKKYEAYPAGGVAAGSGGATDPNQPGYSVNLNFNTKVEYDANIYKGNFVVVSDAFEDYPVGSTVVLTQVSAFQFSLTSPAVQNPLPFTLTVDPATLLISAPRQKIGDWFLWEPTYTNPSIAVAGTTSFVTPCSKLLTVMLDYRVDQGGFGPYKLVLRKP
jgi:hypothetical protein